MTHWLVRIGLIVAGAVAMAVAGLALLNVLPQETGLTRRLRQVSPVDSPQFQREATTLLGAEVIGGNKVNAYQNGAEFFPAMLDDIRRARKTIDLESYIFRTGEVADRFVAALSERARAGVKVHVIADWIGSRADTSIAKRLRDAGVQFEYYHPLDLSSLDRLNDRTHRKLLIVDGRVAYTGGMGIDDEWRGHANKPDLRRDMMFRIEGPGAAQAQGVFENNWIATTGRALVGKQYEPPLKPSGDVAVQTFASAPGDGQDMKLMYLLAIEGARSSIDLEASYFVLDRLTRKALLAAQARGVKVRIIVEGKYGHSHLTLDASRAGWGPILAAGAQIYRFQPSRFHSKLMIVDHYLTITGSANFDNRSFRFNDESDSNVYDRDFAGHMTDVFDKDIKHARRVTLQQWKQRPWTQKFVDWLCSLFAWLL